MGRKRNWRPNVYYHVIMRGNNRENIFKTPEDMYHMLRIISHAHQKFRFSMAAFCIMTNHHHLLIKTEDELSRIMSHVNRRYSDYYSRHYNHVGRIYQQRYHPILIESPQGALAVSRYIHRNPIKTQTPMVNDLIDYPFSSFPVYAGRQVVGWDFLDTETLLSYMYPPAVASLQEYTDYCLAELEEEVEV
ncbi:transposase [Sporosarcina cascadiensis]|uniref:transposase n=1 Tax=Sporosarcina cascadiensis TaxID=2660747 RepID=UPI00129C0BF2|nr:transposase [Sporosarcina cascadiensis]